MRKVSLVLVALLIAFAWLSRHPEPARGVTVVFPLKINGTSWQPQILTVPGQKIGIGKVKDKNVTAVLQGSLPDFAADFLDLDPSGKFFLLFDSLTSWRVATNDAGTNATTLQGRVSNDGVFWMFGSYDLPMMPGAMGKIFVTGKVKFQKGSYAPAKVSGIFYFLSDPIDTGLILKFKTDKPLV